MFILLHIISVFLFAMLIQITGFINCFVPRFRAASAARNRGDRSLVRSLVSLKSPFPVAVPGRLSSMPGHPFPVAVHCASNSLRQQKRKLELLLSNPEDFLTTKKLTNN